MLAAPRPPRLRFCWQRCRRGRGFYPWRAAPLRSRFSVASEPFVGTIACATKLRELRHHNSALFQQLACALKKIDLVTAIVDHLGDQIRFRDRKVVLRSQHEEQRGRSKLVSLLVGFNPL